MYNENNVYNTFEEEKKLVAQGWLENRNRTTEAPKTRSDVRMKSSVTLTLIYKQLTVNGRLNVNPEYRQYRVLSLTSLIMKGAPD